MLEQNRAIAAADREAGREIRKQASLKDTFAGASAGNSTPSAWEKRKNRRQRSDKGEFSEGRRRAMKEETTITFLVSQTSF